MKVQVHLKYCLFIFKYFYYLGSPVPGGSRELKGWFTLRATQVYIVRHQEDLG